MASADRPRNNVILVEDASQWPERLDPFTLYRQTYEPGGGLYYYAPSVDLPLLVATQLWTFAYSGLQGVWLFDDTATGPGNPGPGYLRINAIQASQANELYLHKTTYLGIEFVDFIRQIGQNFTIAVDNKTNGQFQTYAVTDDVADNGDWFLIPVMAGLGNGGNWTQNDLLEISFYLSFPDAIP